MKSMYQGKAEFSKEQLVFVAEAILVGVLDRVESGLPTSCEWEDRSKNDGFKLSSYERGALECGGMALAVLYAQLTGDGLGIYDALHEADKFEEKIEEMVEKSWEDEGKKIKKKIKIAVGKPSRSYNIKDLIPNYPDCHKAALAFVKSCWGKKLATAS